MKISASPRFLFSFFIYYFNIMTNSYHLLFIVCTEMSAILQGLVLQWRLHCLKWFIWPESCPWLQLPQWTCMFWMIIFFFLDWSQVNLNISLFSFSLETNIHANYKYYVSVFAHFYMNAVYLKEWKRISLKGKKIFDII